MNAFNMLVNFVGTKEFRTFSPMVKDAKVFNLGKTVGYRMPRHGMNPITKIVVDYVNEFNVDQWMLPFPTTAVVYNDCATVLKDNMNGRYDFITYLTMDIETIGASDVVMHGYVDLNKSREMKQIAGHVNEVYAARSGNKLTKLVEPTLQGFFLICIAQAIKALTEINTLDRFVLEIASAQPKTYKDKYVPLLEQRPSYILLYPKEIRKYMKTEHEIIGTKSGHERRAHLRRYPDDAVRFPNAHGKVVRIPSVWVGSTESVVGDKKYRVVLDYYVDAEGNIK